MQDLSEGILEKVKTCSGPLPDVLSEIKMLWNNGNDLEQSFGLVSELNVECRTNGIVGTNLTMMELEDNENIGLLAVTNWVNKYINQLDQELKLKLEYNKRANEFSEWIQKTIPRFTPELLPNNLLELESLSEALHR